MHAGALAQTLSFMALLLVWMAVTVENVTTTPSGVIIALAAALIFGAVAVSRLEAIARVREHGLMANATITKVAEELVVVRSGYIGWSTRVTVSFTDTSGRLVRAVYHDHARAGGKKAGQTIQTSTTRQSRPRSALWDRLTPVGLRSSSLAWGRWSCWGCPSTSRTAPGWREKYSDGD